MIRYVGVDVGKAKCRAAIMNQKGIIEHEFFFENNQKGIQHLISLLTCDDQVVMESVRPDRVRCEATKVLPRKITRETI
ncbi:MAG: hypothetical protein FWC74_10400 [Candidatus Bathyarchaeota archaeon]|nr:hypothetical protein [Candidatus Termitimicrobium sp.]